MTPVKPCRLWSSVLCQKGLTRSGVKMKRSSSNSGNNASANGSSAGSGTPGTRETPYLFRPVPSDSPDGNSPARMRTRNKAKETGKETPVKNRKRNVETDDNEGDVSIFKRKRDGADSPSSLTTDSGSVADDVEPAAEEATESAIEKTESSAVPRESPPSIVQEQEVKVEPRLNHDESLPDPPPAKEDEKVFAPAKVEEPKDDAKVSKLNFNVVSPLRIDDDKKAMSPVDVKPKMEELFPPLFSPAANLGCKPSEIDDLNPQPKFDDAPLSVGKLTVKKDGLFETHVQQQVMVVISGPADNPPPKEDSPPTPTAPPPVSEPFSPNSNSNSVPSGNNGSNSNSNHGNDLPTESPPAAIAPTAMIKIEPGVSEEPLASSQPLTALGGTDQDMPPPDERPELPPEVPQEVAPVQISPLEQSGSPLPLTMPSYPQTSDGSPGAGELSSKLTPPPAQQLHGQPPAQQLHNSPSAPIQPAILVPAYPPIDHDKAAPSPLNIPTVPSQHNLFSPFYHPHFHHSRMEKVNPSPPVFNMQSEPQNLKIKQEVITPEVPPDPLQSLKEVKVPGYSGTSISQPLLPTTTSSSISQHPEQSSSATSPPFLGPHVDNIKKEQPEFRGSSPQGRRSPGNRHSAIPAEVSAPLIHRRSISSCQCVITITRVTIPSSTTSTLR
ncbi:unnamed protein product [Nesidiocoris tenuis]|uniref:Uncharacterized protein n=1 Tax=Nesidiocoris tenuis TaxID=355587 RepID=A0A6H5FWY9_9HEMI|nr:unnamed protein product [Nesidiocoris tenuis]